MSLTTDFIDHDATTRICVGDVQDLELRNQLLEHSLSVQRELTVASLRETGLGGIASVLARVVGVAITVDQEIIPPFCERFGVDAANGGEESVAVPIMTRDRVLGRITAATGHLSELQAVALEHGAMMIALELLKQKAARDVEWRLRGELLEELLEAGGMLSPTLRERARRLGVDLAAARRVYAFEAVGRAIDYGALLCTVRLRAARRLHIQQSTVLAVKHGDKVLVALPELIPEIEQAIIEDVAADVICNRSDLAVGVSGLTTDMAAGNREAVACLRLATKSTSSAPRVIRSSDLGPLRFLLGAPDLEFASQMIHERLGALIERDACTGSDLLPTLRAYLEADGHQSTAASARYIHVSTLKYRLKQIRDLVGEDIGDPETAFQLRLAIKLMDLLDSVGMDGDGVDSTCTPMRTVTAAIAA